MPDVFAQFSIAIQRFKINSSYCRNFLVLIQYCMPANLILFHCISRFKKWKWKLKNYCTTYPRRAGTLATAIHDGQKVFAVQVHAGRYKHGVWLMKISDSTDSCQMAKRNEFSFTVRLFHIDTVLKMAMLHHTEMIWWSVWLLNLKIHLLLISNQKLEEQPKTNCIIN